MKKVMFIIHALITGGAEVVTANYSVELKKKGYDVYLMELWFKNTDLDNYIMENGVKVIKINDNSHLFSKIKGILSKQDISLKIKQIIDDIKPEIIHINTSLQYFLGLEITKNAKVFFTNHSDVRRSISLNGSDFEEALRYQIEKGMRLISISSNVYSDNRDLFPNAINRLIPNGVYFEKIRNSQVDNIAFRNENNIPKEAFVIGHIGRFNKVKNHERLFQIYNAILKINPNSYLVLIGTGTRSEIEHIKRLKKSSLHPDQIVLLGNKTNASKYMSCFDVFILPSISESFSLVLIEAQVNGVRCIASDVLPQEVFCNKNCFAVSLNESDDVWANYALGLSECTHSSKIECFEMGHVVAELINYYEE